MFVLIYVVLAAAAVQINNVKSAGIPPPAATKNAETSPAAKPMALGRTDPRVSDPSVDYHHNRKSIDHQSSSSTTQSRDRKFIVLGKTKFGDSDIVPGSSDSSYSPTSNGENSYTRGNRRPHRRRRGNGGSYTGSSNSNSGVRYRRPPPRSYSVQHVRHGGGGGGGSASSSSPSYITSSRDVGKKHHRRPHHRSGSNSPNGGNSYSGNSPSSSNNYPRRVHKVIPVKKVAVIRSRPQRVYRVVQGSSSPPPPPRKIYRVISNSQPPPPPRKIYRIVQSSNSPPPVRHVIYVNSNSGNGGRQIGYVRYPNRSNQHGANSALISVNL